MSEKGTKRKPEPKPNRPKRKWVRQTANQDIRDAMKEKGMGQKALAECVGMNLTNLNFMLARELEWNVHDALMETVRNWVPPEKSEKNKNAREGEGGNGK